MNQKNNKKMEKTLGEKRVRTDFNVKSDEAVNVIKQQTAVLIDILDAMRPGNDGKSSSNDPEVHRLISLAQTAYEEAAMWAVKAATS